MKKVLSICVVLIMVLSMSFTAVAEGAFVSSPSANQAPVLVEYKNESADCGAKIVITSYANRSTLADDTRKKLEDASNTIRNTEDLSTLNSAVAELAKNKNSKVTDLAVSDMFDISCVGCDNHETHGEFDIVLQPDTLKNFVCLLHYYDGKWKIIDNAKVTNNGTHLEFYEKEFSPFAIVVNTGNEKTDSPETEDNSLVPVYVIIMAMSAVAFVFVLGKSKKQSA